MSQGYGSDSPEPGAEIARRLRVLHGLPMRAAALDREGYIVAVNEPWKEFYRRFALDVPNFGVGEKYVRFFDRDPQSVARRTSDLQALLAGEIATATHLYVCHTGEGERRILVVGFPVRTPEPAGATMLHIDVTEVVSAEALIDRGLDALGAHALGAHALGARALDPDDWPRLTQVIEAAVARALAAWVAGRGGASAAIRRAEGPVSDEDQWVQARLTARQRQVFMLLGDGKTNAEIAQTLSTSPNTVKLHVSAILRRLNLESRTQAAILATRLPKRR
jgi:DNA-binding CsgD family transcriptional regulator